MIIPAGAPSFSEALRYGVGSISSTQSAVGGEESCDCGCDEGGFAPNLRSNAEALDMILESIYAAGLRIDQDIFLSLDVASTEFYHDGKYHLRC